LLAIWWEASVIPYASMTGASKRASRSRITFGGSEADEERMNRSLLLRASSGWGAAWSSTAWWMVGTAVYQVGRTASSHPRNRSTSNPGAQQTPAPAAIEASMAAMSPWMWKSGMTLRQRSPGSSASVRAMLRAEVRRFVWVSGTILGRPVVPEVWSTRAMSWGSACAPSAFAAPAAPSSSNTPSRAAEGTSSMTGTPSALATSVEAEATPRWTTRALALRSVR
jgi:hypothetical protein